MTDIQRYAPWPQEWPQEDPDGDLVEYEDHKKIVDALQARADLADALAAALREIDALDPEGLIGGCSTDSMRGLVGLMGSKARAALAAYEGRK